MNIIQVCVAFGLYLAFILLCVGDEGRSPRFGDAAEYPFFSTLWTEKRTLNSMTHFLQLTLDYARFPCEIIVFGHRSSLCLSHA